MLPTSTDVLIVGARPTGLALAATLAARGVRPLLIERRFEGHDTSRALAVQARTLEAREEIGATPEMLAAGRRIGIFEARDGDEVPLSVGFSGLPTRHPFVLMLPQDRTEEILRRRLQAFGGSVARGSGAASLNRSDPSSIWKASSSDRRMCM